MENPSQKHVDVIVKYFFPVAAGIEHNVMQKYAVLQKELGWDVVIHTSTDTYTERNSLLTEEVVNGLHIRRYPLSAFGFDPDIDWSAANNVIALHNFDVFFVRYLLKAFWMKLIGQKNFVFALTPHGGFNPEWSMFQPLSRVVKYIYNYTLGTILINTAVDSVIAVSEWEGIEMAKKGIRRDIISVIPNGLEDEAYEDLESLASEEIKNKVAGLGEYVLQIGRLYKIKNLETSLKAMALAPSNLTFAILGPMVEKEYLASLKELARTLGIENRVVFLGVVRGVDKYYLIKHAQMMLHLALWESFCNVVHEGMSQGLPCIVANNTALPFLIKDRINGFCVETMNEVQVAEKIKYVYGHQNDTDIQEMKKRNREYGINNSWRNVAQKMNVVYRNALELKSL